MIAADQVLADFIAGVQGKKFARILSLLEWADSSKVTTTSHSTHVCNSTPKVTRCPHEQCFSRFRYSRVRFSRFQIVDLLDSCLAEYGLADSCSVFYQIPV